MSRIALGNTYSMKHIASTACQMGIDLILPQQATSLAQKMGAQTMVLPSFKSNPVTAAAEFDLLVEQHGIDAFWPLAASTFDLSYVTATSVHAVCKPDTFDMVNNKVMFAQWLHDSMFRPEGVETIGAEKTIVEVLTRLSKGQEVCIKPPRGVNGGLYWQIANDADLLGNPAARKISPRAFEVELRQRELKHGLEPWLVMEVLYGPELSIDALCVEGRLLKWMIREKGESSEQIVYSDHSVIAHVRHVIKALGLHGIVSVQYMYDKDENIKILEINLRPSGGCVAYGPIAAAKAGTSDMVTDWLQYMAGQIDADDIKQWKGVVRLEIEPTAFAV